MDARRKERISMAREICLHRGENPNAVNRRGKEGWEKYEPLAGAVIRHAEKLIAERKKPAEITVSDVDGALLNMYSR